MKQSWDCPNHIRRTKSSVKKRIIVRRSVRSMFGEQTLAQLRRGFRDGAQDGPPALWGRGPGRPTCTLGTGPRTAHLHFGDGAQDGPPALWGRGPGRPTCTLGTGPRTAHLHFGDGAQDGPPALWGRGPGRPPELWGRGPGRPTCTLGTGPRTAHLHFGDGAQDGPPALSHSSSALLKLCSQGKYEDQSKLTTVPGV